MKAIFNYPSQPAASDQWQCVHHLVQPNQIFDVALYQKALSQAGITYV